MIFLIRTAALLTVLTFTNTSLAATPEAPAVPGEYIVKLRPVSINNFSLKRLQHELQVQDIESVSRTLRVYLVKRSPLEQSLHAIQSIEQSELVEYAEPNYIYTLNRSPNDPEFNQLWGLANNGSLGTKGLDIDALKAWDIETGSRRIKVAVIDTGVDYSIADLAPNMWINEAEQNGKPGVDDDKNGYVDDIHGYDFANNDGDPKDDHSHGSHCAGTIGAKGNNGRHVVGVNWDVSIVAVKFLSRDGGGTLDAALQAVEYATKVGVDIMSNSWGGGGESKALKEAIEKAHQKGILFVAAAGNNGSNNDSRPTYPANYDVPNVVSVAAIDPKGELASFSNYGQESVHVAAPGVGILSTTPNGTKFFSGTSMAAPHVSGVAALVLANQNMDHMSLKKRLINTARPLGGLRSRVASAGIVNAYYALTNTKAPADPEDPFNWAQNNLNHQTPHPYPDSYQQSWEIDVAGASEISLFFERFETERVYDKVVFQDKSGKTLFTMSGKHNKSFSPVVKGSYVKATFISDNSVHDHGIEMTAVAHR